MREADATYSPIAELRRGRLAAQPAYDTFTAQVPAPQVYTLGSTSRALDALRAGGVPLDAQVNFSYPILYANWRREVV